MRKSSFKNKVRLSFRSVKKDISEFGSYAGQWLNYLNRSHEDIKKRVDILEEKISHLEEEKEPIKL